MLDVGERWNVGNAEGGGKPVRCVTANDFLQHVFVQTVVAQRNGTFGAADGRVIKRQEPVRQLVHVWRRDRIQGRALKTFNVQVIQWKKCGGHGASFDASIVPKRTTPVLYTRTTMVKKRLVLGIESSCDETGVAIVQWQGSEVPQLVAHALYSQIEMHQAYGGVVPELASRDHIRRVLPLARDVLEEAHLTLQDLDVVAFTRGPGLAGALLVGAGVACALGASLDLPVVGVHHLEGHLLSPFLSADPPEFPFVALLVSGGHTQLMRVDAVGRYMLLGETIDDAAGEAFDKTAKLMGLAYPGGPLLARLAESGNPTAFALPRPLLHSGKLDFSFAGLKTAVLVQAQKLVLAHGGSVQDASVLASGTSNVFASLPQQTRNDLAASTQAAIVEVLVKKSLLALKNTGLRRLVVAGGVGANRQLRCALNDACAARGIRVHYPELHLCTDNGAMIAMTAAMRLQSGLQAADKRYAFDVKPRWPLDFS
jgi:N6-L-threonylcarbamoyladenine synthase